MDIGRPPETVRITDVSETEVHGDVDHHRAGIAGAILES